MKDLKVSSRTFYSNFLVLVFHLPAISHIDTLFIRTSAEKAPSPGSELDDGAKEDDKDEDYGSGPASHMFSPEAQDDENEDKDGEYTAAPKRRRRSPVEGDDDEDADADADADDEDASPRAKKAKEIRKQKQESKARVRKEEVFENEAPVDEATGEFAPHSLFYLPGYACPACALPTSICQRTWNSP